jgi:predicted restriction endonuclease
VLVANRPRLIRELVSATISDQPDIQVVGEIQQETEMENAVEQMQRRQRFSRQALPSLPARLHLSSDRTDSERFLDADTYSRCSRP